MIRYLAAEILKVIPSERRELDKVAELVATEELKKVKGKHTVIIRG